ncbi:iron-sulfur cluster assembly scaffold protein [Aquimonas sp.]|jgi:nitrogen fixation NifU-like protein|uniref:iron-sulfur cluster assembly scaffold protein n=1 Tax=Aquimonas sp. TaxID=1872588 RepID=UPI0037BE5B3D
MPTPYRSAILDHNRAPHRRGRLAHPSHCGCGKNALCGDSLQVELVVTDDTISDYAFEAEACAIVIATASMLGDALVGRSRSDFDRVADDLRALLTSDAEGADAVAESAAADALHARLGPLAELEEMRALPRRHRCVTLALEAVRAALST